MKTNTKTKGILWFDPTITTQFGAGWKTKT